MKSGIDIETHVLALDNTSLNYWRLCPKKFWYRIQNDLVQAHDDMPFGEEPKKPLELHYGTAWHAGMDELYKNRNLPAAQDAFAEAAKDLADDKYNKRTIGRGIKDLATYWDLYKYDLNQWELVHAEAHCGGVLTKIVHDDITWTVWYHGAIDKILRHKESGKIRVRDHKTTTYINQYTGELYMLSNQLMGYSWLVRDFFGYDDNDKLSVDADIVGLTKVADSTFLRPEIHTTSELTDEWREEIGFTARQILMAHSEDIFPRYGENACRAYNRPCDYRSICLAPASFRDIEISTQFKSDPWNPEER